MDIAAITSQKELYIRSLSFTAGLPNPVNLDVCYTPYGFVFPSNSYQTVLDAINTKQADAMPENPLRYAILTHDNELRYGRICNDWLSSNVVPETQRFYCFADEANSNYLAAMINLMSSNVIEPEMQLQDSGPQLLRRLIKHWPLFGDFLKFKRSDILAELHKRFPNPEDLHFHSQFTRVLKD